MFLRSRAPRRRRRRSCWGLIVALAPALACASTSALGTIRGTLTDERTGEPLIAARVVLRCDCLAAPIERVTDERGEYRVVEALPSGTYAIHSYAGRSHAAKIVALPRGARLRANFAFDPGEGSDETRAVDITATPSLG